MEAAGGLHVPPAVAADDFVFTVILPQFLCVKAMLTNCIKKSTHFRRGLAAGGFSFDRGCYNAYDPKARRLLPKAYDIVLSII